MLLPACCGKENVVAHNTVPPVSAEDRRLANLFGAPDQSWLRVDLSLPTEADRVAADLAVNAAKATHHERNDRQALLDQVTMQILMREA